jgi:glycosyltransferase involved in cell wall biosynthesis
VGRVGLAEVRALVKHVDIHLQPTLWDNAPYSCIEAMAAGRAVVASDCGGLPELVDDEVEGLLAATGDAEAFRVALRRLVDDAPLRERLGRAARRAVEERYTDVAMARRSVELWRGSPAPS